MSDITAQLANNDRVCLIAPAGFGKTEEIVKAVKLNAGKGRQLILTHTNAGVASLKKRLKKLGVSPQHYSVETIDGWCLKYASAYPYLSGIQSTKPTGAAWENVRESISQLIRLPFIKQVILASYAGIYVDEYQDCIVSQHNIVLSLANILPCRVLGDPLQSIFGFKENVVINWNKDVTNNFVSLPELDTPWRWKGKNEDLGKWLFGLREKLLNGIAITLNNSTAITWSELSHANEISICSQKIKETGTIIGIHQWKNDAHESARRMHGFTSMEEMECKDLLTFCKNLDESEGVNLVTNLFLFMKTFITYVDESFEPALKYVQGKLPIQNMKNQDQAEIAILFEQLSKTRDLLIIPLIIEKCDQYPNVRIFRRELKIEFFRTIKAYLSGDFCSLEETVWEIRNQTRIMGRRPEKNTISRTLLIKGLEFDHAIILNADKIQNKENFYVAATRGSLSLTILSARPEIEFKL